MKRLCLLTIPILLTFGCDSNRKAIQTAEIPKEIAKESPKELAQTLPPKSESEIILNVIGSEIFLRSGPGKQFPKIINQKATAVFKTEHYLQIDNSTKVIADEKKDGWSRIRVVDPSYLSETHKGWVPSSSLKSPLIDSSGVKIYTENDIEWNSYIKPHKKLIIDAVNQIARQYPNGPKIDTSSISTSTTKGSKSDPLFFVTMGEFPKSYNIYFSKHDVDTKSIKGPSSNISKNKAIELCVQYTKSKAIHPSTVEFSALGFSIDEHPNGRTFITGHFTAKNNFNLTIKYSVRCLIDNTGVIEGVINETP